MAKNPEITSKGATFIPEYDPDTIVYVSETAFTVAGQEVEHKPMEGFAGEMYTYSVEYGTTYTVETAPVADGYTFLGWYVKQNGVWSRVGETLELASEISTVTVEALWAEPMYQFTMSGKKTNTGTLFPLKYQYELSITETAEQLVGAFASDDTAIVNRTVKREVYIGTGTPGYTEMSGTSHSVDLGRTGSGVKAYVKVTVTYTDDRGNKLFELVVEKNGSYSGSNLSVS